MEFDWAKAKNGTVKAVFALVYVKLGGARALWGEDKGIAEGGYQGEVWATLAYVVESPGRPGIVMYPG